MTTHTMNVYAVVFAVLLGGMGMPEIQWVGERNLSRPDLGYPVLENKLTREIYHATPETGTYSHHGYIAVFRGDLFAIWSNHSRDEDAPGQRVLMSRSGDPGKSWTDFTEIFPPRDEVEPRSEEDPNDRSMIANGFAVADDSLYAVAEVFLRARDRKGLGRLARKVAPGDELGPIFWLHDSPAEPVEGFPEYPAADDPRFKSVATKINEYLAQPEHLPSWKYRGENQSRITAPDGQRLCEPTEAWRMPNGTQVRMWRVKGKPRCNYASFSGVEGRTWYGPIKTEFPDTHSRSCAGNLPNGTAYVINNPGRGRDPLVISLAEDGLTFDRHAVIACDAPPMRHKGRSKGRGFQYPHAEVAGDHLFVVYSVNKEDMQVTRIPIKALYEVD